MPPSRVAAGSCAQLPGHDNQQQAAVHHQRIRAHDQRLHAIATKAAALVRGWTGYHSEPLGSFSPGLNVDTSDLDLGLAFHPTHWPASPAAWTARPGSRANGTPPRSGASGTSTCSAGQPPRSL